MVEVCNCSFNWVELDKFNNSCTHHNTVFDINSVCPFYRKPEFKTLASNGNNLNNAKSEMSKDFTSKSQVNTSKSQRVIFQKRKYVKSPNESIVQRFHNYGVKFNAEVVWDYLFKYEEIRLNKFVSYKRLDFDNAIVKVFKKSILVTLRSSKDIIGLDIESAELKAKSLINEVLDKLPKSIIISDRNVVNTHNAFINDPIAKNLPNNSKVYIDNELRYINDKSKGKVEGEFVSKTWAIPDSKKYEEDLTALIDRGLSRDYLAHALNELIKDRYFHAENMRSHVEAIQTLSSSVKDLKDQVISLSHTKSGRKVSDTNSTLFPSALIQSKDSEAKRLKMIKVRAYLRQYGWGESIWE